MPQRFSLEGSPDLLVLVVEGEGEGRVGGWWDNVSDISCHTHMEGGRKGQPPMQCSGIGILGFCNYHLLLLKGEEKQ